MSRREGGRAETRREIEEDDRFDGTVQLKRGKEGPVRAGHPWIFSGAIERLQGDPAPGAFVRVRAADRSALGVGFYNPNGSLAVRMVSQRETPIDESLVGRRIADAMALRRSLGLVGEGRAFRLLNAEGDGLPGVVADVFGSHVVLQLLNAGADRLRDPLVEAIAAETGCRGIHERSAGGARREEDLEDRTGTVWGEDAPETIEIRENELVYVVDIQRGQKTGFFLDQRDNRALVGRLARGRRVLDCFSYTGGFALAAARGGAERIWAVETSGPAIETAQASVRASGIDQAQIDFRRADVFDALEPLERGERPDLIVLDPPPFARHRADRKRATRAYRDLNRKALRALAPGGMLVTFSCSPHVDRDLFTHIVATAAPAGHRLQLLASLGAAPDHPTLPAHPEGEYLSGLCVRCVPT
jgi:23S rRNA (cytosine1962-C5)-methyltransferase